MDQYKAAHNCEVQMKGKHQAKVTDWPNICGSGLWEEPTVALHNPYMYREKKLHVEIPQAEISTPDILAAR